MDSAEPFAEANDAVVVNVRARSQFQANKSPLEPTSNQKEHFFVYLLSQEV